MKLIRIAIIGLILSGCTVAQDSTAPARSIMHVVLLDLVDDLSAAEREEVVTAARDLLSEIPGVLNVQAGYLARDDRDAHIKDYDVGLSVHLVSSDALTAYATHPKHLEYLELYAARWEGIRVIDFYGN